MKLQIEGQHLRVRINEDELARLLAGRMLEACTQFAEAFAFSCLVCLVPADDAGFAGEPARWRVSLPAPAIREHAARLPAREGLRFVLPGPAGMQALELLFDVDVRDSARRRRQPGRPGHGSPT